MDALERARAAAHRGRRAAQAAGQDGRAHLADARQHGASQHRPVLLDAVLLDAVVPYYWMRGLRFDPPDSCAEALAACAAGASGPGTPEVREQGESGGVREESQSAPGRAAADLQGAK